jgi:2-octaprenylphenol hydroxylase
MTQICEIAIVGGGIVGLTASLAMAKRGFSVAVVDGTSLEASDTATIVDPRVYAINHASQTLLEQLAVWQKVPLQRLSPYQHMHVWDAISQGSIDFDARMIAAKDLGHIVEESILKNALLEEIKEQPNITLFSDSRIEKLEQQQGDMVIASEKENWQAKLLMVADGANSVCRNLLKIPLTTWSYHQEAIVALVNTEKAHQQTAYQVFNSDGSLAFLPLAKENLCSIVWSTSQVRAKRLVSLLAEEFNQELTEAFSHKLGQLKIHGPRYCFPLFMRHARQYASRNWLLLGDAAHTIHPLAGLGLNVGLADVNTWIQCLNNSKNNITQKALNSYQRQRKYAVWQTIAAMEGLKMIFANPLPPVARIRGLGLRFCDNFTLLKKFFIQQAAGQH